MSEFLTKDDFYKYVIENRDRQDRNKKEIIDTLKDDLGDRVTQLERDNRKQNRIASGITALGTLFLGLLAFLK